MNSALTLHCSSIVIYYTRLKVSSKFLYITATLKFLCYKYPAKATLSIVRILNRYIWGDLKFIDWSLLFPDTKPIYKTGPVFNFCVYSRMSTISTMHAFTLIKREKIFIFTVLQRINVQANTPVQSHSFKQALDNQANCLKKANRLGATLTIGSSVKKAFRLLIVLS